MRKISVIIIFILFIIFTLFVKENDKSFEVLEVLSADKIGVDLNRDKQISSNEIITVQLNTPKNLTEEEKFVYEYFSKDFAKNLLEFKTVKFENNNIIVDNQNYSEIFNKHDFSNLKNKDFRILNLKSNKYHYLNCKYGRQSSNYVLVTKNQLPKDAKQCKFCEKKFETKPVNIKTVYDNGDVKFYLTDLSTKLKPDNKCLTPVCKNIVKSINQAQTSIDMALYGYGNVPQITTALKNAQNRGVKLRMVYDLDAKGQNYYTDTDLLTKFIKTNRADNEIKKTASQLMHNKFFIIDGKTVITGSANLSSTDMSGYNSNAILVINSKKIAQIYEDEFEQMYQGKFHNQKLLQTKPDKIKINGSTFAIYFSPQDKVVTTKIIPLINASKNYIYMPSFLITHKAMTNALVNAHKRGVRVRMILDATNAHNDYSAHKILRDNGIQVKTENFAGKMHAKSIIIDDKYVIVGSMNFSKSGENKNDENCVIVENSEIAKMYRNFFEQLWIKIPEKWLKLNARSEGKDSIGSCNDGIDNNFNGKTDKYDDGCK